MLKQKKILRALLNLLYAVSIKDYRTWQMVLTRFQPQQSPFRAECVSFYNKHKIREALNVELQNKGFF